MGATQVQQYWDRAILTAEKFVELWLKEVPGDDAYAVLEMLASLIDQDCRCLPTPWYQDPLVELFKPEVGQQRRDAQRQAALSLRTIVAERGDIQKAKDIHLRRNGLVEAFEVRGTKAPGFLYPPSISAPIRRAKESGELESVLRASKAAALGCDHTADFRSVRWFGVRFTFSLTQASAIEILWKAWENSELGVSQKVIGEAIDSASHSFRLRDLFRQPKEPTGMHPAWKTMIHDVGRGMYALGRPPAAKSSKD